MLKYKLTIHCKISALVVLWLVLPFSARAQWQKTTGINDRVNAITAKDTVFFAGTDTGGVFRSLDKGLHWTATNGNIGNKNIKSLVVHNNRLVAGIGNGFSGAVYYSDNNGASWITPRTQYYGYLFCIATHGNDLLAGTWYGVAQSSDTGATWNTISVNGLPSNAGVSSIVSNSAGIFAGVMNSSAGGTGVFVSTTGSSWTAKNTGLTSQVVYTMATLHNNLFAGTPGGVFKSANNGSTWDTASTGLGNLVINVLVSHGTDLFAGTNGGLYKSSDSGAHWVNIGDTTIGTEPVRSIAFQDGYALVGTNSALYRRAMSQVTAVDHVLLDGRVVSIFPNPCRDILNILVDEHTELMKVEVADMAGRIMYTGCHEGDQQSGTTLNISGYNKGVYLLRIYTGKGVVCRRIVLE